MPDPITLLSQISTASSAIKNLMSLRDLTKDNTELLAFQEAIFEIRISATSLLDQLDAVKREKSALLDEKDSITKENSRLTELVRSYEEKLSAPEEHKLAEVGAGFFARVPQEYVGSAERAPKLCASCYSSGKQSFLNAVREGREIEIFCSECGAATEFDRFLEIE